VIELVYNYENKNLSDEERIEKTIHNIMSVLKLYPEITKYFILQNYAILLKEHTFIKNSVWNEYNESIKEHRYRLESDKYKKYINKQISNGFNEITNNHCQCVLLIRNMKHKKIRDINTTWFEHIQECGIQDQISFFFVKQLFDDCIYSFTENPFYKRICF